LVLDDAQDALSKTPLPFAFVLLLSGALQAFAIALHPRLSEVHPS